MLFPRSYKVQRDRHSIHTAFHNNHLQGRETVVAVARHSIIMYTGQRKIALMKEMLLVSATHKQPATMKAKTVELEHCARMDASSEWVLEVNCRSSKENWKSLLEVCPGAEIREKNNGITVTLPPLEEEQEIAAFGKPGEKDVKRMQMVILGRKPITGRKWIISVHLCDDTIMASENLFKREEKNGKILLAPRSGLFVVNTVDDIRIELNALEPGWEIKESNVKIIKSTDAWNPPENATDFPSCCFEICHVDVTKESFSCTITASHGTETSKQTIMAVFKQIERLKIDEMKLPEKVTYTLPSCAAVVAMLLLTMMPNRQDLAKELSDLLDTSASENWKLLAERFSLETVKNVHGNGRSPTLHLLELWSNAQSITLETPESYWETSKNDIVNMTTKEVQETKIIWAS